MFDAHLWQSHMFDLARPAVPDTAGQQPETNYQARCRDQNHCHLAALPGEHSPLLMLCEGDKLVPQAVQVEPI